MNEANESRRRGVRKLVSFSAGEWERIEARMVAAGARSFDAFARSACLGEPLTVRKYGLDARELRPELARIGNNINQVARKVNIDDVATVEQVQAVRDLLREVQALISARSQSGA